MGLYLTHFSYTPEAWAALVASPEDRRAGVARMLEAVGGSLRDVWYSFGAKDGYVLFEAPDETAAAAYLARTAASGKVHGVETTRLLTVEEMVVALQKAAAI